MKHIKLTQGKHALVDNKDYPIVSQNKWHISSEGYAARDIVLKTLDGKKERFKVYMHQQIMNTPTGWHTHHINKNKFDNRRRNLAIYKTAKEHFAQHDLKRK